MQSSVSLEINEEFFRSVEEQLLALGNIASNAVVVNGVRSALEASKRRAYQIIPKPGYPGDKRGLKALRDTLKVIVKQYGKNEGRGTIVGMMGYEWGAGSHGHIVEHGHDMVTGGTKANPGVGRKLARKAKRTDRRGTGVVAGRVTGKYYLKKAVDMTASERTQILDAAINRAVHEAAPGV